MAKKSHPWYWPARNNWCVELDGRRHLLGAHPAGAATPEKRILLGGENRGLRFSTISSMDNPKALDRKTLVTPGEFAKVLGFVKAVSGATSTTPTL
jgi:hypothetical protein